MSGVCVQRPLGQGRKQTEPPGTPVTVRLLGHSPCLAPWEGAGGCIAQHHLAGENERPTPLKPSWKRPNRQADDEGLGACGLTLAAGPQRLLSR